MLNKKERNLFNSDLGEFEKDISWFFHSSDKVEVSDPEEELELSLDFIQCFPQLAKMLNKARILPLKINGLEFRLYSWTKADGTGCGWMNKMESIEEAQLNLIPEHKLLVNMIGGIRETYHEPPGGLCENQEYVFLDTDDSFGINYWDEYYKELCEQEGREVLPFMSFIEFSREANGNVTVYDPKTKKVLLFATDHAFDNVQAIEGQPESTFYKIDGIATFKDFVEKLAEEWLEEIS